MISGQPKFMRILTLENGGPPLPVITAHLAEPYGKSHYVVDVDFDVACIKGRLFPSCNKQNKDAPDFLGFIGQSEDVFVSGWKRISPNGDWHIWLEFHQRPRGTGAVGMNELTALEG